MVKSASGKLSPGFQGQGAAARTAHLSTNPNKAKPSVELTSERETRGGGSEAGKIANARGGRMDNKQRNNEGYGKKSG